MLTSLPRLGSILRSPSSSCSYVNIRSLFLSCRSHILFNKDAGKPKLAINNKSTLYYLAALGVFTAGMSYAAVPLYRIFCQVWYVSLNFCHLLRNSYLSSKCFLPRLTEAPTKYHNIFFTSRLSLSPD